MRVMCALGRYWWLAFAFLMLTSYAFLQPAFEGFDENPHYSRILDASQDLSTQFTHKREFRTDVLAYPGPEAYASGEPPFGTEMTYDNFYNLPAEIKEKIKSYRINNYLGPSIKDNWQYQHPPLYYLLAGSFERMLPLGAMVADIIALRLFSVLLAVLGLFCCFRGLGELHCKLGLDYISTSSVVAVFVLCFPMFYFEFGRLGNDVLVFLLLSMSFRFSVSAFKSSRPQISLLSMSTCLMLGLWTKAIVLPLLPIFAVFALFCLWTGERQGRKLLVARDFLWTYLLPVALGLGWYVFSFLKFNDIGLGSEARDLGQTSGLIQGLYTHFEFVKLIRGLLVPLASFVYAGSWSLVRAPWGLYVLLTLVYGVFIYKYLAYLFRSPFSVLGWMPLGLFAFLYAGLAYHVLVSMALSGLGTSGGWYLYVLTPWLIMAISIAMNNIPWWFSKMVQWIGLGISAYLFVINGLVYAGHIVKANDKGMQFIGGGWLNAFFEVFSRLEYVSYPWVAVCLFSAAVGLAVTKLFKK